MPGGFIETAVKEATAVQALHETVDRVRRDADYGIQNQRPDLDEKQQKEFRAEQGDGKTSEAFEQALRYHGFDWWPLERLATLPTTAVKTEGEWRNEKLQLAYTPHDLTMSFRGGPQDFDRFIREERLRRRVSSGKVDKKELIKVRRRK